MHYTRRDSPDAPSCALGTKLTLKKFHGVMLSNGSIPRAVLENVVSA